MRYILFVKETCPYCVMAEELLRDHGQELNTVVFGPEQLGTLEEMKKAYDWATVPMVFKREGNQIEFVGGYTDLKEYLESGGK